MESFGLHRYRFSITVDIYWLKRMLDEYPYIGISGLGRTLRNLSSNHLAILFSFVVHLRAS